MTHEPFNIAYLVLVVILGAIMGSFFNMLIYRLPRDLSILSPSSFCPKCEKPIPWWGNIPILSYLVIKGQCAHCKNPIPIRYFVVELITPAAYVLLYFRNLNVGVLQWSIEAFFVSLLIIITFTDLETYLIPDVLSLGGTFVGLAVSFWNLNVTVKDSFLGALVGGGILFLIAYGYQKLRGVEGMGGGDVKLLAMIGAFTGWKGAMMALFSSAVLGTIAGLIIVLFRKPGTNGGTDIANPEESHRALSTMIPYGPFLALGGLGALLWGKSFWSWYLGGF